MTKEACGGNDFPHAPSPLSMPGIKSIYHFTPLHYLLFIARSRKLLCKPSLREAGFSESHFRSTSHERDCSRGFSHYIHLTLEPYPKILKAKLAAGFPHIGIAIPTAALETTSYSLCRFNVAMTRHLRRNGRPGHPESRRNGRYFGAYQIPIARSNEEMAAMLDECRRASIMIEVLVHGDLALPDTTKVVCFSDSDFKVATGVLTSAGAPWPLEAADLPGAYPGNAEHVRSVEVYLEQAMRDPEWRGNGLEFDSL